MFYLPTVVAKIILRFCERPFVVPIVIRLFVLINYTHATWVMHTDVLCKDTLTLLQILMQTHIFDIVSTASNVSILAPQRCRSIAGPLLIWTALQAAP